MLRKWLSEVDCFKYSVFLHLYFANNRWVGNQQMGIEIVHLRLGFSKYDMDFIKLLREKK